MNAGFEKHYSKEAKKVELRQTIQFLISEAQSHLSNREIARRLAMEAGDIALKRGKGGGLNQHWFDEAIESLRRLRDGEITTAEELVREIGDRNLNAPPRRK